MVKLLSPLYFHFGTFSWFSTTINVFNEFVDINVIYFFYFLTLNFIIFYKNVFLQTFIKNLFKLPLAYSINIFLLFFFNFFFTNIRKLNFFYEKFYVNYSKLIK